MPDVEWIMENCYMMRDNGCWAGEKQISYASPDGQTYFSLLIFVKKESAPIFDNL